VLPLSHPEVVKIKTMESWLSEGKANFSFLKIRYYSENYRGVHAARKIHVNYLINNFIMIYKRSMKPFFSYPNNF